MKSLIRYCLSTLFVLGLCIHSGGSRADELAPGDRARISGMMCGSQEDAKALIPIVEEARSLKEVYATVAARQLPCKFYVGYATYQGDMPGPTILTGQDAWNVTFFITDDKTLLYSIRMIPTASG